MQKFLDLHTILFDYMLCDIAIMVLLIPLWRANRKNFAGIGFWVLDFGLQSVANITVAFRDLVPDSVSVVLGSVAYPAGNLLLLIGLKRFFACTASDGLNWFLIALTAAVFYCFGIVWPNQAIRGPFISVVLIIQMLQLMYLLSHRVAKPFRRMVQPTSTIGALFILVFVFWIAMGIAKPYKIDLFTLQSEAYGIFLIATQVLSIAMAISLMHLVTSRLSIELLEHKDNLEKIVLERTQQLIQADKLSSLGMLSAGLAHEINNPNNYIQLNTFALKKWWESVVAQQQHCPQSAQCPLQSSPVAVQSMQVPAMLDDIFDGSQRINAIVKSLKAYATPSASECCDGTGVLNLNEAVDKAVTLSGKYFASHASTLSTTLCPEVPPVYGDMQRAIQILLNLLHNALEANASSVVIETQRDGANGAVVRVIDTGCGIEADHLNRIFDPFFTTRRSQGGSGLGLSIVSRIVTEMKGTLSVDSTKGRGTVVSITFPPCDPRLTVREGLQ